MSSIKKNVALAVAGSKGKRERRGRETNTCTVLGEEEQQTRYKEMEAEYQTESK